MNLPAAAEQFEENFRSRGELGAAVSVWRGGEEMLSLAGGWCDRQQTRPWTADTLVLGWSVTKALASACLLHVLAADGIELSTPVAALWPEFAANGKDAITLAQLLSHQAGLAAMAVPARTAVTSSPNRPRPTSGSACPTRKLTALPTSPPPARAGRCSPAPSTTRWRRKARSRAVPSRDQRGCRPSPR